MMVRWMIDANMVQVIGKLHLWCRIKLLPDIGSAIHCGGYTSPLCCYKNTCLYSLRSQGQFIMLSFPIIHHCIILSAYTGHSTNILQLDDKNFHISTVPKPGQCHFTEEGHWYGWQLWQAKTYCRPLRKKGHDFHCDQFFSIRKLFMSIKRSIIICNIEIMYTSCDLTNQRAGFRQKT